MSALRRAGAPDGPAQVTAGLARRSRVPSRGGRAMLGRHERARARSSRRRHAGLRHRADGLRRPRRRGHGADPAHGAARPRPRGGADLGPVRPSPQVPRHRPILREGGRLARPRAHRAAEAQPRPVASRDGGDRDARGRRLLCPRRGALPQPSRPAPRRPDSRAVHGRRHEPHPVGAGGNPRGRARRSARGAARLGGLEQAHAGPPERAADRLHAATRRRQTDPRGSDGRVSAPGRARRRATRPPRRRRARRRARPPCC